MIRRHRERARVVARCVAVVLATLGGFPSAGAQEAPEPTEPATKDAPERPRASTATVSSNCLQGTEWRAAGGESDTVSAFSEGVSLPEQQQAIARYCEGNALYQSGRYRNAAVEYEEAIALWPHPVFYYNLGKAQLQLAKKPDEIYRTLERAVQHGERPLGEKPYQDAQEQLRQLRTRIAWVTIRCEMPGATVVFNGRVLPATDEDGRPLHLWESAVEPGDYVARATRSGFDDAVEPVMAVQGETTHIELTLTYTKRERRWPRWPMWTTIGIGLAVVGGGGVFHWQADRRFDAFDRAFDTECPEGCQGDQVSSSISLRTKEDRARQARLAAGLGYAVGAGLAITGVTLLLLNHERSVTRDAMTRELVPYAGPGQVGVQATLRF